MWWLVKVLAVMTERQVLQQDRPQGVVPGGEGGEDGVDNSARVRRSQRLLGRR